MNRNLTEIVIISDRSGSMQSIRTDAEGGINSILEKQRLEPGQCNITLVEFDDKYDMIYNGVDIKYANRYNLSPRGSTALFDAVGRTINHVGSRLSVTPEDQRPGLVIVCISTDGFENASREFSRQQVAQMIEHQTTKYNWQFQFMGCGEGVFKQGEDIGITNVVNVNPSKIQDYYRMYNVKTSAARGMSSCGASMDVIASNLCYTDTEKDELQSNES